MNATSERIYRLLLRAYPPEFRAEYGREMALLFRDQCRDGDVRSVGFWARILRDLACSAPALRMEAWQKRRITNTRTVEVIMKLAAVFIGVAGLNGILNAAREWSAGGMGTGQHALALGLAVAASVSLFVAAIALLRPTEQGRHAARLALVASLVLIVASRLLHPWMSIFTQLVGIGLPIVFLVVLSWPRRASPAGAI